MSRVQKALVLIFFVFIQLFFIQVTEVFAFTPPDFPSCMNYSGDQKVFYPTGQHAIVGIQGLKSGSDKVFFLHNSNYLQCYCPDSGSGIQTNWLAAGNLTQEEINDLITRGWTYIPNGSDWGLDPEPFLAKNSEFSCHSSNNDPGGGGNGGGSSSSSGSNNNSSGGQVLGLATLAATGTGNPALVILLMFLGISSISYGLYKKIKI